MDRWKPELPVTERARVFGSLLNLRTDVGFRGRRCMCVCEEGSSPGRGDRS